MSAPHAGGERFIAVESFQWTGRLAEVLRAGLVEAAAKVPRWAVPDLPMCALALFDLDIRSIVGQLGRSPEVSSEKARTSLGWSPGSTQETVIDCADSLIYPGVIEQPDLSRV